MKKLKSNSGASLSLALLLFVVCAVVGSVILAAVTAGSGRMSKLAEMDQRYYSVTSAAELLRDTLDGQCITIIRKKTTKTTTTRYYSGGSDGPKTEVSYDYKMSTLSDGRTNRSSDMSLQPKVSILADFVLEMVFGSGNLISDSDTVEKKETVFNNSLATAIDEKTFYIIPDSSIANLNVKVTMSYSDKFLTLVLASDDGNDKFSLEMLFSADILSNKNQTTQNTIENNNNDSRDEIVTKNEEKLDSVIWQLIDIKKA